MKKRLLDKRAVLLARCKELQALAETRDLTADENTEFRTALGAIEALKPEIAAAEQLEREQADQLVIDQRAAAESARTRPDQVTNRPGAAAEIHDNREDAPFANFGEQLIAIRAVAESRRTVYDPRLRKLDLTSLQVRAAAGMNEATGSEGGFLVGTDVGTVLTKAVFETGVLASKVNQIPLSPNSNGVKLPYVDETSRANGSRWGGVSAGWVDEAVAATASKPKVGKLELGLNKLAALVYMTDELLQDALASEMYVRQAVSEELQFKVDDAIIRGSGAGAPLGILNAGCTVSVAKETSQAAATILYPNVSKMRARMLPRSFSRAEWYINVDCMPQLEQLFVPHKNVAGTENVSGQAVWLPPRGAQDPPNGTLFGRPVNVIEQCETVGTVGDIALLDLGMYLMTVKGGVQAASSIHVNFSTDETAFRFILRTDGQPALKSAVTPYKGSGTLSPFVTLATR